MYFDEVLTLELDDLLLWFGLQPLPAHEQAQGWLFEIDQTNNDGTYSDFQRLETILLGPNQSGSGDIVLSVEHVMFTIHWQFLPDPARVWLEIQR